MTECTLYISFTRLNQILNYYIYNVILYLYKIDGGYCTNVRINILFCILILLYKNAGFRFYQEQKLHAIITREKLTLCNVANRRS